MRKLILCGVLMVAVVWSNALAADSLSISGDGWHSWQVDEPGASTEMCCFTWKRGDKSRQGCNLDGDRISFSDSGDCSAAPGTLQVYIRLDGGEPKDIYVLSANCPVSTESDVSDHGLVSVAENIDWFRTIIEDKQLSTDVREEALFGLVQSGSDAAYAYLDRLLTSR
jgi:hypothetical protein